MSLISFVIAILPVILMGLLIYKIDKEKESYRFLFKLFVLGIISCYSASIISSVFVSFFSEFSDMSFM